MIHQQFVVRLIPPAVAAQHCYHIVTEGTELLVHRLLFQCKLQRQRPLRCFHIGKGLGSSGETGIQNQIGIPLRPCLSYLSTGEQSAEIGPESITVPFGEVKELNSFLFAVFTALDSDFPHCHTTGKALLRRHGTGQRISAVILSPEIGAVGILLSGIFQRPLLALDIGSLHPFVSGDDCRSCKGLHQRLSLPCIGDNAFLLFNNFCCRRFHHRRLFCRLHAAAQPQQKSCCPDPSKNFLHSFLPRGLSVGFDCFFKKMFPFLVYRGTFLRFSGLIY